MPHYEFYCEKCEKEITLTLSIGERERGGYKCPGQGAAAADGHVLLQDVEEGLKGRADGGLHSAAAGVATVRHDSGEGLPDVAQCPSGRCIGRLCPCLCHTSLKLDHEAIAMRVDLRLAGRRRSRQRRNSRRNATRQ